MVIPGGYKAEKVQGAANQRVKVAKKTSARKKEEEKKTTAQESVVSTSRKQPEVADTTMQETPVAASTTTDGEARETPAYARFKQMQQALENSGSGTTPADSSVQNKGLPKWRKQTKSKVALVVAGILGVIAVIGGSFWGINADKAAKAESLAAEYHNSSHQIVAQAGDDIDKALANYDTAVRYVDEVSTEDVAAKLNIQTMTTDAVNDVITVMQDNLSSAEVSLDEANTTYTTMTTYEGQDALTILDKEYEAKNWSKVNEIGAAISENAKIISSLTGDVNTKTNSIFEAYQTLQSEASKTAQEIANNYYNVTIPNLGTIVSSDIKSIEQSVEIAAGYVESINATNADQTVKDKIAAAHKVAQDNQTLADTEFATYMALYDQLQQNYNAGNYAAVSQLGEQMIDSATKINGYATLANENATKAATYYAEYQETANEAYTQAVFEVEFSQSDLTNPEIMKYLINSEKGGKVVGVEQCVYNSNNGEVNMLLDCTDLFGRPYTNLITATIANGLNKDQLTASNLVERLKSNDVVKSQVFDTAMESVAGEGATGTMNAGQKNEVSGDVKVSYSVTTSYNAKTGKTTIKAQAIAVVEDENGNITYKVYSVDPVVRSGNIKVTAELREEFSSKLAQKISADTSLQIDEEASLNQQ